LLGEFGDIVTCALQRVSEFIQVRPRTDHDRGETTVERGADESKHTADESLVLSVEQDRVSSPVVRRISTGGIK
jgi:hypothetical protein